MQKKRWFKAIIFFIFFIIFCNCGNKSKNTHELIIAAASNLQFALKEIGENFTTEYPYSITFVWGSTGSLSNQIENGAPYDIFIAAHESFMHRLQLKGLLLDNAAKAFISGQLAIGVSDTNKENLRTLQDFLHPGITRIVIASPKHAPFGIAAKEALVNSGLWERIQHKMLFAENIRQCLQFIRTGNADAGIVSANIPYVEGVTIVALDPGLYTPLRQVAAILKDSPRIKQAEDFLTYLENPKSLEILNKYNYSILPD